MHKEILTENQLKLLSIVALFSKKFGLVGDTAIAFHLGHRESIGGIIKLPDILTLAAMKAFALGRRAKWKDYVDLYFILRAHHKIAEITARGVEIFGNEFNEKIFRIQLAYFKDIDYSETVIYKKGFSTEDEIIKKAQEITRSFFDKNKPVSSICHELV